MRQRDRRRLTRGIGLKQKPHPEGSQAATMKAAEDDLAGMPGRLTAKTGAA